MALICQKYKDVFPELQARIIKTYLGALAEDKSLSTVYGGLVGLYELTSSKSTTSVTSIITIIIPFIESLEIRFTNILKSSVISSIKSNQSLITQVRNNKNQRITLVLEALDQCKAIGMCRSILLFFTSQFHEQILNYYLQIKLSGNKR